MSSPSFYEKLELSLCCWIGIRSLTDASLSRSISTMLTLGTRTGEEDPSSILDDDEIVVVASSDVPLPSYPPAWASNFPHGSYAAQ